MSTVAPSLPKAAEYSRAKRGTRRVNWSDTYTTESSVKALAEIAGITIMSVEEAPAGKCFLDDNKRAWRVRVKFTDSRGKRLTLAGETRTNKPLWAVVYSVVRMAYRTVSRNEQFACCKCSEKHYSQREKAYIIPCFLHYANGVCFECGGAGFFVPALYAPSELVIQSDSISSAEQARRIQARNK